jgi:hypothetical protein
MRLVSKDSILAVRLLGGFGLIYNLFSGKLRTINSATMFGKMNQNPR